MNGYRVMQLPSGWWAVFYNGQFINASLRTSEECIEFIKEHKKKEQGEIISKRHRENLDAFLKMEGAKTWRNRQQKESCYSAKT